MLFSLYNFTSTVVWLIFNSLLQKAPNLTPTTRAAEQSTVTAAPAIFFIFILLSTSFLFSSGWKTSGGGEEGEEDQTPLAFHCIFHRNESPADGPLDQWQIRQPASLRSNQEHPSSPGLNGNINPWVRQKKSNCLNVSSPNSVDEGRGSGVVLLVDIQPGLTQQELRQGGI